jgi:hypothetical protein
MSMNHLPLQTDLTMKTTVLVIIDRRISLPHIRRLEDLMGRCLSANQIGGHSPALEKLTFMESHQAKRLTGRPLLTVVDQLCHYLLIVRRTTSRTAR